ncbi:MAG: hypothetical protein ABSB76_10105 [Streptosporangiaceae bacterium]|jgi:hypothetical protein
MLRSFSTVVVLAGPVPAEVLAAVGPNTGLCRGFAAGTVDDG